MLGESNSGSLEYDAAILITLLPRPLCFCVPRVSVYNRDYVLIGSFEVDLSGQVTRDRPDTQDRVLRVENMWSYKTGWSSHTCHQKLSG
jgi:hypothetical protein